MHTDHRLYVKQKKEAHSRVGEAAQSCRPSKPWFPFCHKDDKKNSKEN